MNKLEEARKIINEVDQQMAELFVRRMQAAEMVLEHKQAFGLPILDPVREAAVIERNAALIQSDVLRGYYVDYLRHLMSLSRAYQHRLKGSLRVADRYDIVLERGVLARAKEHLDLSRRVLIVTDSGVPAEYVHTLAAQCLTPVVCTVEAGEPSKSMETLQHLLQTLLDHHFSRRDCVAALGGGVTGDLAGFAAAVYMRGIDFYNLPTTLLAQIDSSIGGKTAVNLGEVKNVAGAFYPPQKVLIDPDLLRTLPPRQLASGLAEAVKMALTSDAALFELMETQPVEDHLDEIILRALLIKKSVVEQDEKEDGLRRILNFGHTIGHAIESSDSSLLHGECVALGLVPMCGAALRPRVIRVLEKCGLYRLPALDWDKIAQAMRHDKKADGETVEVTTVSRPGQYEMKTMTFSDVIRLAQSCLKG